MLNECEHDLTRVAPDLVTRRTYLGIVRPLLKRTRDRLRNQLNLAENQLLIADKLAERLLTS